MIVTTRDRDVLLIRQTAHGQLSGDLARGWGNDRFCCPQPLPSVVLAAAEHDNGWAEWERQPRVDPATHLPYQFWSLPPGEHLGFYWRGVERVLSADRYAGLLVSLHCAGLYNQRFGTDPSIPIKTYPPAERRIVAEFLERLDRQQARVWNELKHDPAESPAAADEVVWANYKLLQIFDRFSLYLCMPPLDHRTLGPAPVDYDGTVVTLEFRPDNDETVAVSPYPFRDDPFRVSVEARLVPKRHYANDEDFRQAFERARPFRREMLLRKG